MIKYRFLYFKTLTDFQDKLSEIDRQSIVFIQDKKLIWTHGEYYGEVPEAITIDSELSNLSINPVQNNVVKRVIDILYNLCEQTSDDVDYIKNAIDNDIDSTLQKFQEITNFLNSIQDSEDSAAIIASFSEFVAQEESRAKSAEKNLADDISDIQTEIVKLKQLTSVLSSLQESLQTVVSNKADISDLLGVQHTVNVIQSTITEDNNLEEVIENYQAIKDFITQLQNSEDTLDGITSSIASLQQQLNTNIQSLENRIRVLESKPSSTVIIGEDGIAHIFTTLEEYQALNSYQENAIYFILEPNKTWTFGGTFPIIFTDGLGTFPITLT